MFISLSQTLAKFGKFRIGFGIRVTKNNYWWMSIIVMFVYIFQAAWYMCVVSFWLFYAICYGIFYFAKWAIDFVKFAINRKRNG